MKYILFFLLFLLPFIYIPFGTNQFELPKILIAEIGIGILGSLWFLNANKINIPTFFQRPFVPILGLLLLSVFDLIFLPFENSFFGNEYRLQGIFLFWIVCFFSFLSSCIVLPKVPKIIYFFLSVGLLLSCFLFGTTLDGRAFGTLGEPNALAAIAIFLLPFGILTKQKKCNTLFSSLLLGITFCIILLSGSTSGLLAWGIEIVNMWAGRKFSLSYSVILCLFVLGIGLFFVSKDNNMFENRYDIWKTAFHVGLRYPLAGIGIGNVELGMKSMSLFENNRLQDYRIDSTHNIFLDWWVQGGIIGLSLFIMLIFQTIIKLTRHKSLLELTIFLGLLTCLCFNPGTISILLGFWWVIGRSLTLNHKKQKTTS